MVDIEEVVEDLKEKRDRLKAKIHLASKDLQGEFDELDAKWNEFRAKARLDRTAEGVSSALGLLGDELKRGYERIKKAI